MSSVEADLVIALVDHALTERPPSAMQRRLRELAALAGIAPGLVLEELESLAEHHVESLPCVDPTVVLHRVVSLHMYQRYCVVEEWRYPNVGSEEFHRHVERENDPDGFLKSVLSSEVVFPAAHSWLIDSPGIEELCGQQLVTALRLDKQNPPFVLCRMSPAEMIATGVRIRRPTGFDAVLGRHTIWSPDGVPAGVEYVDLDIPGTAVEATLWRP